MHSVREQAMKNTKYWRTFYRLLCSNCNNLFKTELQLEGNNFAQYVYDIACTTKSTSQDFFRKVNALHKNLLSTLGEKDANGEMFFFDINICVSKENKNLCKLHRKRTDTSLFLCFQFRSIVTLRNIE